MGSFATSLHVKTKDADGVAAALRELLAAEGWEPTEKELEPGSGWGEPSNLRGMQIAAAHAGWVSVLDSDMAGAHGIVSRLAARLSVPVIFCYVNDSDSWGYLLADSHGSTNEFDSAEGAADDDAGEDLVNASAAMSQINALMQDGSLLQKMQEVQARMSASAPAEIRAAEERIKSGRGTAADMQQYQAWAMQEMPKHLAEMKSLLGGALHAGGVSPRPDPGTQKQRQQKQQKQSKAQRAAWNQRLQALRPLLAAGVTDDQVQEVCQRQAVFAEETLGAFLKLLGITDFYAHLSYHYLDESGPEELAAYKIRFEHHLRFESTRLPSQLV